jgi:apolipoprotein N-acyltransferase
MFRIADGRQPVDATVAPRLSRLHEWFFAETEREARAGARLVAWPEMNFLVPAAEEPAALARAQRLAAQQHVFLAMSLGAVRAGAPRPFRNETVLIGPDGGVLYSYAKSRPVIGWEESVMEPGDGRLPLVDTDLGRLSTAICFEGDIPGYVRQVGRGGADLWILPANDWPEVSRIHFAMAAFRAVENGAPLLRPTSFGTSGAFDAFGRAVGATDHLAGGSTLVTDMPVGRVPTLYARVGDLFSWLCVVGLMVAGVRSFRRVGRPEAEASPPQI